MSNQHSVATWQTDADVSSVFFISFVFFGWKFLVFTILSLFYSFFFFLNINIPMCTNLVNENNHLCLLVLLLYIILVKYTFFEYFERLFFHFRQFMHFTDVFELYSLRNLQWIPLPLFFWRRHRREKFCFGLMAK